jgi:hypothetical protein
MLIDQDGLNCTAPSMLRWMDGVPYCQSPCTTDQTWNSTTKSCQPVDCLRKYRGSKSWYNPNTGLCEAAAVCIDLVGAYIQIVSTDNS